MQYHDQKVIDVFFRHCRSVVRVRVENEAAAELVRGLFPEYVAVASDVGDVPGYSLAQEGGLRWMCAGEGSRAANSFDTLVDAVAALEYDLTLEFLGDASHMPHLHAAGAVADGRAVLALGPSGAGKSSIALSWSSDGLPVLGDDVVFVGDDHQAMPFKRLFKVEQSLLVESGIDRASSLLWSPENDEVWFDPRSCSGWSQAAEIALIARIAHRPGVGLKVESMSKSAVLGVLLSSVMTSGRSRSDCVEGLMDLADSVPAVEVEFADARGAARSLAELLK